MTEPLIEERQVGAEDSGQRLDQVAARQFPGYSRARLQKWIRSGALTVDGLQAKPSHRLVGGERLRLAAVIEAQGEVLPQDLPLDLVHADADVLVVDKPAGLVVHPAAGNPDGTLQNALLHYDADLAGVPRAGIVHRLDKDTSGLLVVARHLKAHASLVAQLQARAVGRIYETIVHGLLAVGGSVDAPIGRHPGDRKKMAVVERGKPAATDYRVLSAFGHFSHLEVSLRTGRTHQIRVHMRHLGLPLVGDPTYGRKGVSGKDLPAELAGAIGAFSRQALHARRLSFEHPGDGRSCSFEASLPPDFAALLAVLERYDRP